AHGVMVLTARKLVVRGALAQVRRVNGAGRGQGFEASIYSAARERRPRASQLFDDLIGRAVASQLDDGLVHHRPLSGASHARGGAHAVITRSERSARVSSLAPCASTTTSSSMRTPPQPWM